MPSKFSENHFSTQNFIPGKQSVKRDRRILRHYQTCKIFKSVPPCNSFRNFFKKVLHQMRESNQEKGRHATQETGDQTQDRGRRHSQLVMKEILGCQLSGQWFQRMASVKESDRKSRVRGPGVPGRKVLRTGESPCSCCCI